MNKGTARLRFINLWTMLTPQVLDDGTVRPSIREQPIMSNLRTTLAASAVLVAFSIAPLDAAVARDHGFGHHGFGPFGVVAAVVGVAAAVATVPFAIAASAVQPGPPPGYYPPAAYYAPPAAAYPPAYAPAYPRGYGPPPGYYYGPPQGYAPAPAYYGPPQRYYGN